MSCKELNCELDFITLDFEDGASEECLVAGLYEIEGKKYYFGCNVLGKLLVQLRETKGKIPYNLPEDLHLFGKPILAI